jgi:hypothetical protein
MLWTTNSVFKTTDNNLETLQASQRCTSPSNLSQNQHGTPERQENEISGVGRKILPLNIAKSITTTSGENVSLYLTPVWSKWPCFTKRIPVCW